MAKRSRRLICGLLALLWFLVPHSADARIVINEVMGKPLHQSTAGRYEFIELYNSGNAVVDISGYILTDSADYADMCSDPLPTSTADHEGFFIIPSGTYIGANDYLTLWHTAIPGVTDNNKSVVYSGANVASIVINDHGDDLHILRCQNGTPVVVDEFVFSFDFNPNISLERVSADDSSNNMSNWYESIKFTEEDTEGATDYIRG